MNDVPDIRSRRLQSKAWPYEEARKLLKRWPEGKPAGAPIIFETGYGPSGLPHIGTGTRSPGPPSSARPMGSSLAARRRG